MTDEQADKIIDFLEGMHKELREIKVRIDKMAR